MNLVKKKRHGNPLSANKETFPDDWTSNQEYGGIVSLCCRSSSILKRSEWILQLLAFG